MKTDRKRTIGVLAIAAVLMLVVCAGAGAAITSVSGIVNFMNYENEGVIGFSGYGNASGEPVTVDDVWYEECDWSDLLSDDVIEKLRDAVEKGYLIDIVTNLIQGYSDECGLV